MAIRRGVGELFRNPDLAHSLELVASGGRDAFYKGPIAKQIVAFSTKLGGTMTAEDLAEYSSEWVEPISTNYHGWTVYEIPPNGQGIAALEDAQHHGDDFRSRNSARTPPTPCTS